MSRPLRVGSVPYLNARPLVVGLDDDPRVEYRECVPSRLAGLLEQGEVDVALVSSVEILRLPGARRVTRFGVVSDGAVWSVLLAGEADPTTAARVALDEASLTAATLARIAYREFFQRDDVHFARGESGEPLEADARLIIGDPALDPGLRGLRRIDLGELWTERTGLPFVWALWLARPGADHSLAEGILEQAARRGLGAAARFPEFGPRHGVDPALASAYLRDAVRFRIGEREEAGLSLFLDLARRLAS